MRSHALFDGETLPQRVEILSHEGPRKCCRKFGCTFGGENQRPKRSSFQGDAGGAAEMLDPLLVMKKRKELCHFQGDAGGAAEISDLPFVLGYEVKSIIFKGDAGGAAFNPQASKLSVT